MALPYNGTPPFEKSSDTSEQAAEKVKPSTAALRERVLAYFKICGARGSTCDEAEQCLNMLHQTCSARVRELVLLKQLVDTGNRRETRSGRKAAVYVVTAIGPAEQERRLPTASICRQIEKWNAERPVGTPVRVTRDDGSTLDTTTRSLAWDLCGTPVVSVDGISGGYALDRVAPR